MVCPASTLTPHRPLMVSITVNLFKPLVGTLVGGVTTGSLWPEEDATTTADEVDASLVEEYPGGPGSKSESGAPYAGPEELSALLTRLDTGNSRIPQVHSHHDHPWPFRRQKSFSRELIQKLDGCECSLGKGGITMR